jgi:hypothetical protein
MPDFAVRDRPDRSSPRESKKAGDFPARKPGEPSFMMRRPSGAIRAFFRDAVKFGWEAGSGSVPDADISSLLEMLESVGDPRDKRGRQHELAFILAVCVVATLTGAGGYPEISRKARDTSQELPAKLRVKLDLFRCRYKCPSKLTIRRVLSRIDTGKTGKVAENGSLSRPRKTRMVNGKSLSTGRSCVARGPRRTRR